MTTETQALSKYQYKSATNRLGLWLFIVSDSFLFLGLLATRFYLFGGERPDVSPILGVTVTSVLLLSSFFMNRAEILMSHGDRRGFLNNILITIVLGTLFLVGVVGVEWQIVPFSVGDNAIASVFFTMTGFHAFHVLTGVIFLLIVYRNARKGLYSAERHFVDVVWVFFYPALYLIGRAAV
jgi:cytochrome c oxidase subunit 3